MRRPNVGRAPGQSIVVIALMMVVLIALVGLSVDVGNTYGQQRRVQSAVNSAALSGMLTVKQNKTNTKVLENIQRAMQGHGLDLAVGSNYAWKAYYIVPDTAHPGQNIAKSIDTYVGSATAPTDLINVAVTGNERVDAYFTKILSRRDFPAKAVGFACTAYGTGIYPMGVPFDLQNNPHTAYTSWNYTTHTGTVATGWTTGHWGDPYKYYKIPRANLTPGQQLGWMNFSAGDNNAGSNSNTAAAMTAPGLYHNGPVNGTACNGDNGCYHEADAPSGVAGAAPVSPYSTATQHNNKIEPFDWLANNTGTQAAMDPVMQKHEDDGDTMVLPIFGDAGGNGSHAAYQILALGKFRLVDFDFQGGDKYVTLEYLGPATPESPVNCTPIDTAGVR